MSKYLSRKIKFISLFSMLAVVFIHSYNYKDSFLTPTTKISEGLNYFAMFEYFISNALARFAVPLYFIISGYLFFKNYTSVKESYLKKLKSRTRSLIVPYLIWAFISALFMYVLSFINVFSQTAIVQESVTNGPLCLLSSFINPPAFQLWYVQQLIIFTLISPLFYLLIKYTKGFILILIAVPWVLDLHSAGAYIALFEKEKWFVRKENPIVTIITVVSWIVLSLIITILAAIKTDFIPAYLIRLFLYRINESVGISAMWMIFDHIFKRIIMLYFI